MFNITLHRSPVSGRLKHDAGSLEVVVIPVVVLPILERLHARKGLTASAGLVPLLLLAFAVPAPGWVLWLAKPLASLCAPARLLLRRRLCAQSPARLALLLTSSCTF